MATSRRLLTIGHSYAVGLNRRLGHEIGLASDGRWDVTIAAPRFVRGDFGAIRLQVDASEPSPVRGVELYLTRVPQLMWYGSETAALVRDRWDVVHAWVEPYVTSAAQLGRWRSPSSKLVFYSFQNINKRYPPPFGAIERYALRKAAGWIAAGETVAETLTRPSYLARPHRVIPLGVDTTRFRPSKAARDRVRRELGIPGETPVIGFSGRFVEAKGLPLLMRILPRLTGNWHALFLGGGPFEARLREWGAIQGSRVHVLTGVTHDRVPDYLNAMDVQCAPSQTTSAWREQLGRMLLEAFASGVPILASDSGEIPRVVGDAGVVISETDDNRWLAELQRVLDDRSERERLSAAGLQRAHEHFSWPVIAHRHIEFFDALMDGSA